MEMIASVRLTVLAGGALVAAARAQTTAQKLLFPSPYFHETGAKQYFRLDDFDGDGILDMTGFPGAGTLRILPGQGDGTFGPPVDTGSQVGASLVADFDADGMPDLASALGGQVSVVLATGPFTFGVPTGATLPSPVNDMTVGDANGDGFLDIVASAGGSSSATYAKVLATMVGDGAGGIAPPIMTGVSGVPASPVMRDFDGDAVADLAVMDVELEMLRVFLGVGDGAFYFAGQYPTEDEPRAIAAGDWNGDGAADLAVSTYYESAGDLSVFVGTGRGTFDVPPSLETGASYSQSIVAADFDQDGRDDLALATNGYVAIVLRDFTGTGFADTTRYAGQGSSWLAPGDLNGDGWLDLAAANYNGFSVLLAAPGGALLGATGPSIPPIAPTWLASTSTVVIEDFDGDGRLDLAGSLAPYYVPGMPGNLAVALGDGAGQFTTLHPAEIPGHVRATGDLDVDGVRDLLVASISFVSSAFGAGDGTFTVSPSIYGLDGLGTGVIADLDGDGAPDAVLPAPSSYAVSVLLNNGDGTLGAPLGYGVGKIHGSVAVGDLDLDGDPELVSGEGSQFIGLHVFEGVGDGTFLPPVTTPLPFVGAVEVRDHDQDGRLDVALVSKSRLYVLAGDGAGGLGPPMPLTPSGTSVGSFAFADLDGVGTIDLTAATAYGVGVLLGLPDGTLGPSTVFGPYGVPRAAELNGDGRVDIAVASGGMLCLLFHQGEAPAITSVGGLPASSAGTVLVQGGPFDATTEVKVEGAPAPFDLLGPSQLGLALGASVPGLYDVEIAGTFGSALAGDALERWPSLAAGPATIGQPLALDLESGGAGPFALALSGGLLGAPLPIPDVYYGLWLSPAHLISAGSVAPGQTGTSLSVAVPADPGLSGATIYFQAWAWPIGLALAPPSSFSNYARVVVQ